MKKLLILFGMVLLLSSNIMANTSEELLKDIKILIEQNGKKIEQNGRKIEQNGKIIAILDSKVVNIEHRLDFMQNIIYIILAAILGVPMYFEAKRTREDRAIYKSDEKIRAIITALRELSQDDPKIKRSLDIVGLS